MSLRILKNISLSWYGLPFSSKSQFLFFVWLIATLLIIAHFFWKTANRQLQNPQATFITKSQSYQITLVANLWILGFASHGQFEFYGCLVFSSLVLFRVLLYYLWRDYVPIVNPY